MVEPVVCRYLFLDVAGTVLDKPGLPQVIAGVLAEHGITVEPAQVARRHKIVTELSDVPDETSRQFYDEFNRRLLLALGVAPDQALVQAIYDACVDLPWRLSAGAEHLTALSQPIGVISNWRAGLSELLEAVLPFHLFRTVDSTTEGIRKPDVRLFEKAMAGLDCTPAEIAFVGDSVKLDLVPAAAAGMTPVLYDPLDIFAAYQGKRVGRLDALPAMLVSSAPQGQ